MTTRCGHCKAPVADDGYLCNPCTKTSRDNLNTIRTYAQAVRNIADRQATNPDPRTRNTPESQPPINITATEAHTHTITILNDYGRIVAHNQGRTWANLPAPISVCVDYLRDHTNHIRTQPWAPNYARDIDRLIRTLTHIADGPPPRQYLGPCGQTRMRTRTNPARMTYNPDTGLEPMDALTDDTETYRCDGDVYAQRGSLSGNCGTCGHLYNVADRRAWLDSVIQDHLFTAAEIADAYGLNRNTINQWARRGRLTPHGRREPTSGGTPGHLYRVGDVLDLARQAADRRRTGTSSIGTRTMTGGGCEGQHHGPGTPGCPRHLHHHHDHNCGPNAVSTAGLNCGCVYHLQPGVRGVTRDTSGCPTHDTHRAHTNPPATIFGWHLDGSDGPPNAQQRQLAIDTLDRIANGTGRPRRAEEIRALQTLRDWTET